jgi:hypothetical protein
LSWVPEEIPAPIFFAFLWTWCLARQACSIELRMGPT